MKSLFQTAKIVIRQMNEALTSTFKNDKRFFVIAIILLMLGFILYFMAATPALSPFIYPIF